MKVLRETLDTTHGHYNGTWIGQKLDELAKRAAAEGYDSAELKWWDVCEGWVTMNVSTSKAGES